MKRWFEEIRERGLSLRITFFVMLIVSLSVAAALLYTNFRTIKTFHSLADATDAYIDLQEAADRLLKASDYLTEQAQCYSVLGFRENLDNYFYEAEVLKNRENAIQIMESRLPDSQELRELKEAMKESVFLMKREYYAMLLVLQATGDENVPAAMADTALLSSDAALSSEQKMEQARLMMHNSGYYSQKDRIRAHLNDCLKVLKDSTHGAENTIEKRLHLDLNWMTVLIVFQTLSLVLLLWVTTSLGINPLLQAVEHIKHDQTLPITGANEFRYLAGTYNTMYTAYKRSIDNLSFKASHDELTGVYNRAGYDLIVKSVNLGTTAFLLVDADRFKSINDQYGHEVGDKVLKKIAGVLKQNFRTDDYVCRIGGDEFVILMVHVNEDVRHLLESKVIQINRDLADAQDGLPPLSVSVGIAMCDDKASPQEMFHSADIALYYVKENGRNGCCFYNPGMRERSKAK